VECSWNFVITHTRLGFHTWTSSRTCQCCVSSTAARKTKFFFFYLQMSNEIWTYIIWAACYLKWPIIPGTIQPTAFLTILVITENHHLWSFFSTEISFYLISHLMHLENLHIQLRKDTASETTGLTSLRCLCMLAWSNYLLGAQRYKIMIRNDYSHHRTLHHPTPEVLRVARTFSCLRPDQRWGGTEEWVWQGSLRYPLSLGSRAIKVQIGMETQGK